MPKDKERSVNPAAAQRKLDKQKSLKKSKAEALARRNEKLARRNPDRIQRQINDLKSVEESGQQLRPREKQLLEALEKDLRAVQKAREALGDKAPKFGSTEPRRGAFGGRGRGDSGVLGKRRRDDRSHFGQESDSSETDEDVRRIPMPRDTPPPIPREYQRRKGRETETEDARARGPHPLPAKPAVAESRTVYEAKPEIRDLRQEAISKFIPAAVRAKQEAIRGQGKLLEPEEMDRLEKIGYQAGPSERAGDSTGPPTDQDPDDLRRLQEEEERFNRELRSVQIEEVEDEDA
ncbi:WW domain binding protein 11-domain-containing protein [Aspergillus ambiguus]|uniref:WW domain binding protein 11 n=1 Tax=Aspergillus ambiguus TaxID=176160 RepID=UPI003CCD0EC6